MKLSNSNKGIRILTDYNVLCGGSECFVAWNRKRRSI
jgi:hypothetical protein